MIAKMLLLSSLLVASTLAQGTFDTIADPDLNDGSDRMDCPMHCERITLIVDDYRNAIYTMEGEGYVRPVDEIDLTAVEDNVLVQEDFTYTDNTPWSSAGMYKSLEEALVALRGRNETGVMLDKSERIAFACSEDGRHAFEQRNVTYSVMQQEEQQEGEGEGEESQQPAKRQEEQGEGGEEQQEEPMTEQTTTVVYVYNLDEEDRIKSIYEYEDSALDMWLEEVNLMMGGEQQGGEPVPPQEEEDQPPAEEEEIPLEEQEGMPAF
ncbi:hypothetical protein QOT17_007619 [Balamuthia mandrillaris]